MHFTRFWFGRHGAYVALPCKTLRRESAGDARYIDGPAARVFQGHARLQFDIGRSHLGSLKSYGDFQAALWRAHFLTAQSSLRVISKISTIVSSMSVYRTVRCSGMRAVLLTCASQILAVTLYTSGELPKLVQPRRSVRGIVARFVRAWPTKPVFYCELFVAPTRPPPERFLTVRSKRDYPSLTWIMHRLCPGVTIDSDSLPLEAPATRALVLYLRRYTRPSWWRASFELALTAGLLFASWFVMWISLGIGYWLTLLIALPAAGFLSACS